MSTIAPTPVPLLSGVGAIAEHYDGFILDVWGVLYDGGKAYPGVVDCLERLKAAGKRILVLSNAPRRSTVLIDRLSGLGIPRHLYDEVHTSGEETFIALRDRADDFHRGLGNSFIDTGGRRFSGLLDGLAVEQVDSVDAADFVLANGPREGTDTIEMYDELLGRSLDRGLPMLCANPDLEVLHEGERHLCAGSIGARYEAMGGRVQHYGKPHAPVYERCLKLLDIADRSRILAVGDNLETDVRGGRAQGTGTLLVAGGIHCNLLDITMGGVPDTAKLDALYARYGERPTAAVPAFAW